MPTELREIIFRGAEIAAAVTDYYRRRTLPLPPGQPVRVAVTDSPALGVSLTFHSEGGPEALLLVTGETLRDALIAFCLRRHIPLPADGEKRLQRVGEDIALLVVKRSR